MEHRLPKTRRAGRFGLPLACATLFTVALAVAGCEQGQTAGPAPAEAQAEAQVGVAASGLLEGWTVQQGTFEPFDMSGCCTMNCQGNNPATPYQTFHIPPGPGQTATQRTLFWEDKGTAPSDLWRLREDEAVVYVGATPGECAYFSFTPYLFTHGSALVPPFASLSESLNNGVIRVDGRTGGPGVFNRQTVVIVTADGNTFLDVAAWFVANGYPEGSINRVVLDGTNGRINFGLDESSDTLTLLFRAAVWQNDVQAYPTGSVFRLTPPSGRSPLPMSEPPARPKGASSESALTASVGDLRTAIVNRYLSQGYLVDDIPVRRLNLDPGECVECLADSRDTNYLVTDRSALFTGPDDFYVAYGVNHAATGKASYASVSVYAWDHVVGLGSADDTDFAGSAASFLPGNPNADKLYAHRLARATGCADGDTACQAQCNQAQTRCCKGDPHCLTVRQGACSAVPGQAGINDNQPGMFGFRAYLEPSTWTAPDPTKLVYDRLLRFRKRCNTAQCRAHLDLADFDGDGRADRAVFYQGTWYVAKSGGGSSQLGWGGAGDVPVPGDYDGDGVTDLAIYRPSNRTWYVSLSHGGTLTKTWVASLTANDVPVPGDYDGDGKTDLAVFRPALGTWYIALSSTGYTGNTTSTLGVLGDIPVPADYDGDAKTDLAVFRRSTSTWIILQSRTGTIQTTQWGTGGDAPVPGDYDGDGKADIAVYRPSNGIWYVALPGWPLNGWGWGQSVPVPADYDGDGKVDLAVEDWRAGNWYIYYSATGQSSGPLGWGWSAALPVHNQRRINAVYGLTF